MQAISEQVPEDRHAVVIMDGAGWHSEALNRQNVTLLKLPPYSPELNPVEQVWQWVKQKHLSNRVYEHYDAIVDACCEAWNHFVDTPSLIAQMCSRKWAKIERS